MHDHNNNNNGENSNKGMMWMMLVCCLVPVIILFGGTAFLKSIGYGWIGIVLVLGFIIFRFRQMSGSLTNSKSVEEDHKQNVDKGNTYASGNPEAKKVNDKGNSDHKSCCH